MLSIVKKYVLGDVLEVPLLTRQIRPVFSTENESRSTVKVKLLVYERTLPIPVYFIYSVRFYITGES